MSDEQASEAGQRRRNGVAGPDRPRAAERVHRGHGLRRRPVVRGTDLVVDALAVYRITRLIQEDDLTIRPRNWAVKRSAFLADLIDCPWCLSIHVAAGVVLARVGTPRLWGIAARVLAFSAMTGVITGVVDHLENADH